MIKAWVGGGKEHPMDHDTGNETETEKVRSLDLADR